MTKIALIDASTVHHVWPPPEGETEIAMRHTLPNGDQISPVILGWSDGAYSIAPVAEFVVPEGKRRVGAPSYAVDDGTAVEIYEVEDIPPPDRVTSRQFKLQLLAFPAIGGGDTLLDDVEAWIATQSRAVQIAFENSDTFVRTEPMMQAGFAALGFSEGQIDAFFTAASVL